MAPRSSRRPAWLLVVLFAGIAGPARADVVPRPPDECPPGSDLQYYCGLAFCRAFVCKTDADCTTGTCQPTQGCFREYDWTQPPQTEHGGPCQADDTCSGEEQTCETIGLCLPGEGTSSTGDGTTTSGTTSGTTTGASSSTGAASTGVTSTSTGAPDGTSTSAPTSGAQTGADTSGEAGSSGSHASAGDSGDTKGGCTGCSSAGGAPGLLGLVVLAALRRRRARG